MPGATARRTLTGTRFADVRWVEETGSTNADLLAAARQGEPEGVVLVADHQTAGRGRAGRTWVAPPDAALLMSVLLRPPVEVASLVTTAVGLAAVRAVGECAGVDARLKWPNDLVVASDPGGPNRKLAGILAEADWPARSPAAAGWSEPSPDERVTVVVGIGLNVRWGDALPDELAEIAGALDHLGADVDREELLIALLQALDVIYAELVGRRRGSRILDDYRACSATLGQAVRVDLGASDIQGTAVDITADGHLVVETLEGDRREIAVGDVVHLR